MRYAIPTGGRRLDLPPVLESWDEAGSPSQLRLAAFLDSIDGWLDGAAPDARLALGLTVGLPGSESLTSGGRDLDNYLVPLVRKFGHHRFYAVFANKVHAPTSTLAIAPVAETHAASWLPKMTCRTSSAGQSQAWKHEISTACSAVAPAEPLIGGIALNIHYRLSAQRNWMQQWKPTIDALGPVLGVADPRRPFDTLDDRVVSLELSRTIDKDLGWDIEVTVNWSQHEVQ